MSLKSTNIWDDIRDETDHEGEADSHHSYRRGRSSIRPGSTSETEDESQQGSSNSSHANRHGISMKSLFKNRAG